MTVEQIRNKAQQLVDRLENEGYTVGKKVKEVLSNPKASPKTVKYYLSSTYIKQHAGYYRQVGGVNIDTPLFTASQRGDFETKLANEIIKSAKLLGNPSYDRSHQVDVYYKWVTENGKRKRMKVGRRIYSPARAARSFMFLMQLEIDTNIKFLKNVKNVNDLPNMEVDMDKFKQALRNSVKNNSGYYEALIKATVQNPIFTKEGREEMAELDRRRGIESIAYKLYPNQAVNLGTFSDAVSSFLNSSEWQTFANQRVTYYEAMQVEARIRTWNKIKNDNNEFNNTAYGNQSSSGYLSDSSRESATDIGAAGELFQAYALKHGFFI